MNQTLHSLSGTCGAWTQVLELIFPIYYTVLTAACLNLWLTPNDVRLLILKLQNANVINAAILRETKISLKPVRWAKGIQ